MTDLEIPQEARSTDQEDFVLLCAPSGYTSQMVRLAAVEKGAKWRQYTVDYRAQTNLAPWYMKINSRCDFPTLLHGNE